MTTHRITLGVAWLLAALASGLAIDAVVGRGSRRGTNDREMAS